MQKKLLACCVVLALSHYCFGQTKDDGQAKTLYLESTAGNLARNNDHMTAIEINQLNAIYTKGMTDAQAISAMTEFRTLMAKQTTATTPHSVYEYGQSVLEFGAGIGTMIAAKQVTPATALATLKSGATISKYIYDDFSGTSVDQALNVKYSIANFDDLFQKKIIESALDRGQSDPSFLHIYNLLFEAKLGHNTSETATQILTKDPVLAHSKLLEGVMQKVADVESKAMSDAEKEQAYRQIFSVVLDSITSVAKENNVLLKKLTDQLNTQQNDAALQAAAAREKELTEIKLEAASSAVGILSKTLGLLLPGSPLPNQISTLGTSAISIASSISKFNDISAKFSGEGGDLLGGIILSGNIFSAATNILGLFSSSHPTPDEMIMNQLKGISNQIDTMYTCMNKRFDAIDTRLDTIYVTLNKGFSQIDYQLHDIKQIVSNVQETVSSIKSELDYLSIIIANQNYDLYIAKLQEDLETVNSRARNPAQMNKNTFINVKENLHLYGNTYALKWAKDQGVFGATLPENENNQNLYNTLVSTGSTRPSFELLNIILQNQYHFPFLSTADIADPSIWLSSSNGLLKLANTWPQFINNIDQSDIADLIDRGNTIQSFESKTTLSIKANGATSYPVIDNLLEDYRQHCLSFLNSYFTPIQDQYIRENVKGVNPFFWRTQVANIPSQAKEYLVSVNFPSDAPSNKTYNDNSFFYKLLPDQYNVSNYFGFNNAKVNFNLMDNIGQPYTFPHIVHVEIYPPANPRFPNGPRGPEPVGKTYQETGHGTHDQVTLTATVTYLDEKGNQTGADNSTTNVPWGNVTDPPNKTKSASVLDTVKKTYNCASCAQVAADRLLLQQTQHKMDSLNNIGFVGLQNRLYQTLLTETTKLNGNFKLHAHGELDYFYELLREVLTVALPRSISGDDSLIAYFQGRTPLLNTANIQKMLSTGIAEINNNGRTDYIDWAKLVNDNVDGLKAYLHKKLDMQAANHQQETIIPIDATIESLKLLQAQLSVPATAAK